MPRPPPPKLNSGPMQPQPYEPGRPPTPYAAPPTNTLAVVSLAAGVASYFMVPVIGPAGGVRLPANPSQLTASRMAKQTGRVTSKNCFFMEVSFLLHFENANSRGVSRRLERATDEAV